MHEFHYARKMQHIAREARQVRHHDDVNSARSDLRQEALKFRPIETYPGADVAVGGDDLPKLADLASLTQLALLQARRIGLVWGK